jgi:large subunit ribosomal protein L21
MYAVIEANGRHLKVKEGDFLRLDRIAGDANAEIVFDRVVLAHDGKELMVGSPLVQNASVSARVVRQGLAAKVMAFRYKPKKRVRTRHGHRQPITELRIEKISLA